TKAGLYLSEPWKSFMRAIIPSCASLWRRTGYGLRRIRNWLERFEFPNFWISEALLFRSQQQRPITPELQMVLSRRKPVCGFPVLGKRRRIDDSPVGCRFESGVLENADVIFRSKQVNGNIDVLCPFVAVRIFFVVTDQEKRLAARFQDSMNLVEGEVQPWIEV